MGNKVGRSPPLRSGSRATRFAPEAAKASSPSVTPANAVRVTKHAVTRYIERVERVSPKEARRRIASAERAILKAAEIGCACIKVGGGVRYALEGATVVSVYAGNAFPRSARQRHRPTPKGGDAP